MPSTGPWGFLSLAALIVIGILIGRNFTFGGWFSHTPIVSLVCTGGELTTNYRSERPWTDSNPGLSMTVHLDTHFVQVHVSGNQPIEAPITETEDDIHFVSRTVYGDLNRLTGRGRLEITADDGRTWRWDALECARRSQRF
jgi:hypothetical protein